MNILRKEEGQTLVLTALCMSVLLGFMALALDVGVLFHTRRSLQTAADAAALAGAADYLTTSPRRRPRRLVVLLLRKMGSQEPAQAVQAVHAPGQGQ